MERRSRNDHDWQALATRIVAWGRELGFGAIGIADTDLAAEEARLVNWLAAGRPGAMDYRPNNGSQAEKVKSKDVARKRRWATTSTSFLTQTPYPPARHCC
jgi:epoxyqueuosine reductase